MHEFLTTPAEWARWLALCDAHPDLAPQLEIRGRELCAGYRATGTMDLVDRTIGDLGREFGISEVAPPSRVEPRTVPVRRSGPPARLWVGLAAGLLVGAVGVLGLRSDSATRGGGAVPPPTVVVSQGRAVVDEHPIGVGARPLLSGPGPFDVGWTDGPLLAWVVEPGAPPRPLGDALSVGGPIRWAPTSQSTLVLVDIGDEEPDPDALMAMIGDGRGTGAGPTGSARWIAYDWGGP